MLLPTLSKLVLLNKINPKKITSIGIVAFGRDHYANISIKELERCINDLGMSGIQIGTNINGIDLSDDSIFPVFEAAADLGASVFVHPWSMMGENQLKKYWLPWLVGMPAETSRAICSMIFGGVFEGKEIL